MASILKSFVQTSAATMKTSSSDTTNTTKQHQNQFLNPRHIYHRYIKDIRTGSTMSWTGTSASIKKEISSEDVNSGGEHSRKYPNFIKIKIFDTKELTIIDRNYPLCNLIYIEHLVHELAIEQGIGPIYKSLFGLKIHKKNIWLSPNQLLCELLEEIPDIILDFRMRFMPFKIEDTKIDANTFNYIFAQIRYEFITYNEKEPTPNTSSVILGLTVTDLLRHSIENDIPVNPNTLSNLDLNKHLPPAFTPTMRHFSGSFKNNKQELNESLQAVYKSGINDILFIKQQFISHFLENLCPNYGSEQYTAEFFYHFSSRPTEVKADLKYSEQSFDLNVSTKSSIAPSHIRVLSIYDVCYANVQSKSKTVELSRTSGPPFRFRFSDELTLKSFVSCIDGYYRLMKKWYFNLCKQLESPSLVYLRSIHSHGPIELNTSLEKLLNDGGAGSYVIRQSRSKHHKYYIDVLLKSESDEFKTIGIEYNHGYFVCQEKNSDVEINGKYECLKELIREIQIHTEQSESQAPLQLKRCLFPSEYDDIIELLVSLHSARANGISTKSGESDHEMQLPKLIPKSMLQLNDGKIIKTSYFSIQNATFNKQDVTVKKFSINKTRLEKSPSSLSQEKYDAKLLTRLADWIYVREDTIVKTIGITIPQPICLVQEYLSGGPLDVFLRSKKENGLQLVHLFDAVARLARALWYLQEKQIIHGKIRCQNIFVACNWNPKEELRIKLSDPMDDSDMEVDSAFYPPESNNLFAGKTKNSCRYTSGPDVWAFGTTVWQIFNYGIRPLSGMNANHLPRPKDCIDDLWRIMEECWLIDPCQRIQPQSITRDVHYAIYGYLSSRPPNNCDDLKRSVIEESYSYISDDTLTTQVSNGEARKDNTASTASILSENYHSESSLNRSISRDSETTCSRHGSDVHLLHKPIYVKGGSKFKKTTNLPLSNSASGSNLKNWTNKTAIKKIFCISKNKRCVETAAAVASSDNLDISSVSTREFNDNDFFDVGDNGSTISDYTINSSNYSTSDSPWLVEYDRIKLGKLLGQGSCGKVYKAELSQYGSDCNDTVVAVKSINNGLASETSRSDLKREFDILKTLDHDNIVKILGLVDEPLMLVMEFIPYNSLTNYLKVCRDPLNTVPLLQFAIDIAKGMEYLEYRRIVHRDLAARNILVQSDQQVKISDFGLAQYMDPLGEYYKMKTKDRKLPLKWYAPETLETWIFTCKTDVWSYGVVLWEMYSGGDNPIYPNSNDYPNSNGNLLHQLKNNVKLKQPIGCPAFIYALMLDCWKLEPDQRKSFSDLKEALIKQSQPPHMRTIVS